MKLIKLTDFTSDKLLKNRLYADKLMPEIMKKIPKNEKEIIFSFENILLLNPSFLDQIIDNFKKKGFKVRLKGPLKNYIKTQVEIIEKSKLQHFWSIIQNCRSYFFQFCGVLVHLTFFISQTCGPKVVLSNE